MHGIQVVNVSKRFADESVLENFSLTIPSGNFFALLGPSGCGKTTLLRLIAGFEKVDTGQIFLNNQDITHLPANQRRVNTVFQNYALFPHLNVFENVAYSLQIKKLPRDIIQDKVRRVLQAVHMGGLVDRPVTQLSGGQRQRVALARAIVNEPEVLLLDEPLAALDLKLREKMLVELIDLQNELATTFVYVTHDQNEALAVADLMAIMNYAGKVEQLDRPAEIYEYPKTGFVAQFVGSTNLFHGTLVAANVLGWEIILEGLGAFKVETRQTAAWLQVGALVQLSIRPEKMLIMKVAWSDERYNFLVGEVTGIIYLGRSTQYNVALAGVGREVQVFVQNVAHSAAATDEIDYEDQVYLAWPKNAAVLLPQS